MQTGGAFSGGEKPGHIRHLSIAIDAHAAHRIVRGGTDFHWYLRDVDIGELLELVVHAGQLAFDVLARIRNFFFDPRDVEEHATMWTAPPFAYFTLDAAGHVIAREQFGGAARVLVAGYIPPA